MLVRPLARIISAPLYMCLLHIDMGGKAGTQLHSEGEFVDAMRAVPSSFDSDLEYPRLGQFLSIVFMLLQVLK
jgi:hypothetical protein